MTLRDELVRSGNYLFRWRSYLPLILLGGILFAMKDFTYFGGTEGWDDVWDVLCVCVSLVGLAVRILTVGFVPEGTSGRNTKRQIASTLNRTGMYSLVRHPLYVGNFLIWLGIAMFPHEWWVVAIAILAFWVYYERIILAEEDFLAREFGAAFQSWAARTPTFVPRFSGWRRPTLPFSWRTVLAREYSTLFALVATFFLLEVVGDFFLGKLPHFDLGWLLLVGASGLAYVTLRWMKKRRLLVVDGR